MCVCPFWRSVGFKDWSSRSASTSFTVREHSVTEAEVERLAIIVHVRGLLCPLHLVEDVAITAVVPHREAEARTAGRGKAKLHAHCRVRAQSVAVEEEIALFVRGRAERLEVEEGLVVIVLVRLRGRSLYPVVAVAITAVVARREAHTLGSRCVPAQLLTLGQTCRARAQPVAMEDAVALFVRRRTERAPAVGVAHPVGDRCCLVCRRWRCGPCQRRA